MYWVHLFGVTAPSGANTSSVVAVFLQFGVLGAFALVSLWFFLRVYKRESDRADRAEAAKSELEREVRGLVIPALTEANRASTEAIRAAAEVVALATAQRDRERR